MPIHMRDLVFHVSNQKTVELSAEALIKGVLENIGTVGTKADVAHVVIDLGNNLAALAGALTWGTKDQRLGQVNPAHICVNPPKNVRWPDRPVRAPAPLADVEAKLRMAMPLATLAAMPEIDAMLAGADGAQHRVDQALAPDHVDAGAAQEPNGPIDGRSDA